MLQKPHYFCQIQYTHNINKNNVMYQDLALCRLFAKVLFFINYLLSSAS